MLQRDPGGVSGAAVSAPDVSPGSSRIAFISFRYRIGDSYGYGLYTMRPDGSDVIFVSSITGADVTLLVWSPNGQHIAFLVKEYYPSDGFEDMPEPSGMVSTWAMKVVRWDGTDYAIRADGSHRHLIHFEKTRRYDGDSVSGLTVSAPDVFPDGRIVYTSIFGYDDFDIVVADHDGANA